MSENDGSDVQWMRPGRSFPQTAPAVDILERVALLLDRELGEHRPYTHRKVAAAVLSLLGFSREDVEDERLAADAFEREARWATNVREFSRTRPAQERAERHRARADRLEAIVNAATPKEG